METVNKLELPLILDQLTEGRGNCFPIAILQPCKTPEIKQQLKPIPKILLKVGTGAHSALRHNIKRFITKSDHPRILEFRCQYEEFETVDKVPWDKYWMSMTKDQAWVDYWFIQATAWYLELDIWITATSSREDSPYIVISGNLDDANIPCNGPVITLGTKSNSHYQSLLPIEMFHLEFRNSHHPGDAREFFNNVLEPVIDEKVPMKIDDGIQAKKPDIMSLPSQEPKQKISSINTRSSEKKEQRKKKMINETLVPETICPDPLEESQFKKPWNKELPVHQEDSREETDNETRNYIPFVYEKNGKKLTFKRTSYDYKLVCPSCHKETKYMIQHICKGNCPSTVDMVDFKEQLKEFKKSYTREKKYQVNKESIKRQRAQDNSNVKEDHNKRKK